jgi:sugar-specific transcriptional regulator TrmB
MRTHGHELIAFLTDVGLSEKEALIYVAGRRMKSATAVALARQTHIKRPTVYHTLSLLEEKGLVSSRKQGKQTVYAMAAPERLSLLIEARQSMLAFQAEQLRALASLLSPEDQRRELVEVEHFEGVEGVMAVFERAFRATSKKWDVIAPYNNFLRQHDKAYAAFYLAERKRRRITSRTLWEHAPEGRALTKEDRLERNPRLMPWSLQGKFTSMMILFDTSVVIISSYEEKHAVLITSKEIHALFAALFEGIWEVSEAY